MDKSALAQQISSSKMNALPSRAVTSPAMLSNIVRSSASTSSLLRSSGENRPLVNDGLHAAVVLSHFCEVHGPSVIFCSQMMHRASSLYDIQFPQKRSSVTPKRNSMPRSCSKPDNVILEEGSIERRGDATSPTHRHHSKSAVVAIPQTRRQKSKEMINSFGISIDDFRHHFEELDKQQQNLEQQQQQQQQQEVQGSAENQQNEIKHQKISSLPIESRGLKRNKIARHIFKQPDPFGSYMASSYMPNKRLPTHLQKIQNSESTTDESDFDDTSLDESEDSEMEEIETDDTDNNMPFPGLSPISPSLLATVKLNEPKKASVSEPHLTESSNPKKFNSTPTAKTCSSCDAMNEEGYISIDEKLKSYFVSSKHPHSSFYSAIRSAAVRSLSCEVSPNGREGSFFFSSDDFVPVAVEGYNNTDTPKGTLHAVCYVFKLKDAQFSRGFHRWYSLLFVSHDKIHLLFSYDYLISKFEKLARELQLKAEEVFEKEQRERGTVGNRSSSIAFPTTADLFRRRVTNNPSLRSVVDLVDVSNLFERLHSFFAATLKGYTCSMIEKSLEKNQKVNMSFVSSNVDAFESSPEAFRKSLLLLKTHLSCEEMKWLLYHIAIGNQIIVQGNVQEEVKSTLHFIQMMLPPACARGLVYDSAFKERWECNLFGLSSTAEIPEHVDPNSYVLLNIDEPNVRLRPAQAKSAPVTTLSTSLYGVLTNKTDSTVKISQMKSLSEQWINKAKLFFSLSKNFESDADARIKKFLQISKLIEADIQVLKFWTTGLKAGLLRKQLFTANVSIL